ncbi:melanocyte-stimulating hormone receptor-like [Porites lutea]|uniref:melanocyte-stimulating hormone receptor-like n=1 Tax=Porites lutea TaxID=51062 RepID=UPI003CC55C6D
MALKNFTENYSKTVEELSCSAEFFRGLRAILLSALNIFLSITAFLGNTLILVALRKETSLHAPSKLLYRNLEITELCVGIIADPLAVTYWTSVVKERGDICYYAYLAENLSGHTLCSVSLLTLIAISLDRPLALLLGLRYRQVVTLKRTQMALRNFNEDVSKTLEELSCPAEFLRGGALVGELIFLSALNIFLSMTAILGNTLILVALHKKTSLHPPSKLLYRNLAITDLCVGIIVEPLAVTYFTSVVKERWDICYHANLALRFSGYTLCGVSITTSTAISVDRLLALLLGLRYRQLVTLRRTCIIAFGFWILSIVGSSSIFWNPYILLCQYIFTALCLVTIIYAYTKISYTLHHNQIHVHNHVAQGQQSQAIPALNIARYKKTVFSAMWVQGTLIICYLPYFIAVALQLQRGMTLSIYRAQQFTATLVSLNSSLNPLLYCWKIREVRQAVKETLRQMFRCSS